MLRRKCSLRDSYARKLRFTGKVWNGPPRSTLKRGKPLKKISKSQRNRLKDYYQIRNEYLLQFPACAICLCRGLTPAPATEVHHMFGRNGSLLTDTRGFVSSCRGCREWPHDNAREARALGILGEPWEWGVPIDRHRKNALA